MRRLISKAQSLTNRFVSWAITLWRTSIQARILTSVVVLSAIVIATLGFGLATLVAQRLLDSKVAVANEEIDRARATVEMSIENSPEMDLQALLNVTRSDLVDRFSGADASSLTISEPLLVAPAPDSAELVSSPVNVEIPEQLRAVVHQGQVAYQTMTMTGENGNEFSALVIGTPTATSVEGLELYLIMPMAAEESTLGLVRGLLAGATVVILVLLGGITWFFSNQVTAPVRSAARIAQRWANGYLRERMVVQGEDDMARLAMSFNTMAESLSQQIRHLEEYSNLQRQFTSDVSHELRTPLTTVRMAADLIADSVEDLDPATKRASELMNDELDRFEMLLNDLLEISRHDAGVADLSAEKVDVRQCVDAAFQPLQTVATESNTKVIFDLPDEPVVASVDSRRIERVLRNLLANAIDHSEGKPVVVAVRASDTAVSFTVTDHGVGLKPEQEQLVFNRFWRADPSRERRTGGTGLGLAIAKEDANLHGGELEAHGIPGVGSCFRLSVPVDQDTPMGTAPLSMNVAPWSEVAAQHDGPDTDGAPEHLSVPPELTSAEQSGATTLAIDGGQGVQDDSSVSAHATDDDTDKEQQR